MVMLSLIATVVAFAAPAETQVRRVSPSGESKQVQQIRVEFSAPVVRFGTAKGSPPVTGDCLKNGDGRWIDTNNWVFDFKAQLPGGLRCTLKLREGLTAVDGKAVTGKKEFSFSTGGPAITNIYPETYSPIDEDQAFIAVTDAETDAASVEKSAFLSVQGVGDRVPLKVVRGSEEERILKAFRESSRWEAKNVVSLEKGVLKKLKPVTVLKADRRFPFDGAVALHWGKGIRSQSGAEVREEQNYEYKVRADFIATFSCQREEAGKPCIPLLPMTLNFSNAVGNKVMEGAYIQAKDGKKIYADMQDRHPESTSTYFEFKGPFRAKTDYKVFLPSGLKDETGRALANASKFPLDTATGENPPLLKFASTFGVIEGTQGAALPVTVRDIEAKAPMTLDQKLFPMTGQVQRIDAGGFSAAISLLNRLRRDPYGETSFVGANARAKKIELQKPSGEKEFEVVGIPLPSTGLYFVEVESPRLGEALLKTPEAAAAKRVFFVRSMALVTKMAAHLKYTSREAFVWVTSLQTSAPVEGADVQLLDCDGKSLASGKTAADGTLRLAPSVDLSKVLCDKSNHEFYAVAAKGGDFTFTSSEWDNGIETWRYRVNTDSAEPVRAHTILDRSLLRPGETVSMKHVLRRGTKDGFGFFANSTLPKKAVIEHESGLQSFEFPLKWNVQMGTAEGQWKIPMSAKLGRWSIRLESADKFYTSSFRVENYKVPLLRGQLKLPDQDLVSPASVPMQIGVEYLAGGGAGPLDVKTRWSIEDTYFTPDDDELADYAYLNGGVKEGLTREENDEDTEGASSGQSLKGSSALKLDAAGTGSFDVKPIRKDEKVRSLRVEAEYRDANGEIQTVGTRANLWPSDRIVGIKSRGWTAVKKRVGFDVVVLDLKGKPVEGVPVEVDIFKSDYVSHRKRLVGGFFGYESYNHVKKLGRLCQGTTDRKGRVVCEGPVTEAGSVRAVARIKDQQGRVCESNANQYVVDSEERLWFGSSDADRVDLIAEKKRYEPGETAEFRFEAPFRQAKVLVTVEREGLIEHQVVDWDASKPTIRLPVKENWAPNVFISALALRGRVGDIQPTAMLDLGKPAFKMGLSEIRVGWKKHELKVKVSTDAKTYKVRSKAKAQIVVTDANGKPVKGEVTVAAVDEGLLQLLPNSSWQLLERMMDSRPLLVRTATNQSQVIGKRHFGLKAVAAGGDGGRANLRELFDTLLLWKGTVALDAKGQASVEIPVNDSLTSFKVVAIALNGHDQFGTGSTSFRTTQELMIFSGAPVFAREGDRVMFTATIRNTGSQTRNLEIGLKTDPLLTTPPKTVSLDPGHVVDLSWALDVPSAVTEIRAELSAKDGARELDRMKSVIRVGPVWRSTVRQSTLVTVDGPQSIPVEPMGEAVPGTSKIQVEPVAGLASSRAGLKEFWANYRYNCLEQKTSRFVTLADVKGWRALEADLDSYIDDRGRLKYFPGPGDGSMILTVYVLSVAKEAGFSFSAEHEKRLLETVTSFADNKESYNEPFAFADEPARRVSAMNALSRYGKFKPTMLSFVKVTTNLWPTSSVVEWYDLVSREKKMPGRAKFLEDAENTIRTRMIFTGGKFAFSDEKDDDFWWLMRDSATPTAWLILATAKNPAWKADLPKVIRGFIEKQSGGAWLMTTSNAWGRLALDRYKEVFEKDPVAGEFKAVLGSDSKNWDWKKGTQGELTFAGPAKKDALKLAQQGTGKPYAFVRAIGAVPLAKPVSSGYTVERVVEPVNKAKPDQWTRGDVVKIVLKVHAMADAGWVVVEEPLPPGGIALGSGFGNDSSLLQSGPNLSALWSAFEERGVEGLKTYFAWFPAGDQVIEYRVRFNQAGTFQLPATRIQAMYDPDVFAEVPNAVLDVKPQ